MNISNKLIIAGRWTIFLVTSKFLLHYFQLIILARILLPIDFGLAAITTSIVSILSVVSDLGVSSALMHYPKPSSKVLSSLYWINFLFSIFIAITIILMSNLIAELYGNPEIKILLTLTSIIFPLNAISTQFRILAEKELQFSKISLIELNSIIISFISAIVLALNNYGVYSIVIANIIFVSLRSLLIIYYFSHNDKPLLFLKIEPTKKYIKFGIFKMAETLSNTLNNQLDIIFGGYYSNPGQLATYSIPKDLCLSLSNTFINPVVTRISLPAMAKIQNDLTYLRKIYRNILILTSSLNYPIYFFMFFFSKEIIEIVLGKNWLNSVDFLSVFAIWGLIRSTGNPTGSLLYSTGRVKRAFYWNIGLLIFTSPIVYLIINQASLFELSLSLLLIQVTIFYPSWRILVYPSCGMKFYEFIKILIPSFIIALISTGLSYLLIKIINTNTAYTKLICGLVIASILYLLLSYWFNNVWLNIFKKIFTKDN